MSPAEKIDVHSHFVPPKYRQACEENGHSHPDGMPAVPPWTEEAHLEMMDSINVSKAILSITSPGTHLVHGNDKLARTVTRECNEYAADMKKRYPQRIGFFASTPLPDVQGTLEEVKYALDKDKLNADGIAVKTNHHGTYLGHKDFDPVMEELNSRKAIVFIHPTTPCMTSGQEAVPLPGFPRPMFEFFFETARAAINLFMSGTVERYPHITYILSHCGGALPPMIRRFSSAAPILGLGDMVSPDIVKERFSKQFYFDTAGWAFPEQIKGLLEYTTVDRILYGSDFPFTPLKFVTELSQDHDKFLPEVFSSREDQEALRYKNALRLLES